MIRRCFFMVSMVHSTSELGCWSMPIMGLVSAEQLAPDVTLSFLPLHCIGRGRNSEMSSRCETATSALSDDRQVELLVGRLPVERLVTGWFAGRFLEQSLSPGQADGLNTAPGIRGDLPDCARFQGRPPAVSIVETGPCHRARARRWILPSSMKSSRRKVGRLAGLLSPEIRQNRRLALAPLEPAAGCVFGTDVGEDRPAVGCLPMRRTARGGIQPSIYRSSGSVV